MEMKEPNEPGEKKIDGQDETAAVCTTDMESSGHSPAAKQDKSSQQQAYHEYIFHISASAIVGGSFRAFLSRFFGGDCEDGDVNDFLTPLSNRICVTAGGRTMQTGGALFQDMPANFLGCFIMGFISPLDLKKTSRIPWHHQHHPLQQDHVFHTGLGVGLCGCLTTFASWNSQMVVMMDGTFCDLGSQVISALSGYALGIMISCSAFQLGRDCAYWLHCWKNPDSNTDNNDEEDRTDTTYSCRHYWTKHFIYLVAIFMVVAFVVGSVVHEIQFYRQMILMSLLAPFGALLRWKLSIWNNSKHCVRRLHWLPWGTFSANMLGAIISILCTAFLDRHNDYIFEPWVEALIVAVKVGFAGSLSTVSSLVKEMANLSETFSGHAKSYTYGSLTILGGMFMGLCIYSGIVRSI